MELTETVAPPTTHTGLVYSAHARCQCGAGLAIEGPALDDGTGAWQCATILRGESDPGPHDEPRPVRKHLVKYEGGPGVLPGANTRPSK